MDRSNKFIFDLTESYDEINYTHQSNFEIKKEEFSSQKPTRLEQPLSSSSSSESNKSIYESEIELEEQDEIEIKKRLELIEKDLESALEDSQVNVRGVYISVIVSFIFIILCLYINPIERVAWMSGAIKNYYEDSFWEYNPNKQFKDIESEEEVDTYIRNIVIPLAYEKDYINFFNYVVSMRFTLKLANLVENPFEAYEEAVEKIRENSDIDPFERNEGEKTDDLPIWDYKNSGGFLENGGYVEFFSQNATFDQALYLWRQMRTIWLNNNLFSSFVIDIIFHNSNLETTLYYYQVYQRMSSGVLEVTSGASGIFPSFYSEFTEELSTIIGLGCIYILGLLLQIYKFLENLRRTCKTLWTKLKLDLVWNEYLEMISISLSLTSVILYIDIVLANSGSVTLPVSSSEDFEILAEYANDFRKLVRLTAVSALLISFEIIVVLKNKFPSFGVLFDTIRLAKTDIINFGLITFLLLIAFGLMGLFAFGVLEENFSTIGESLSILFDMILGVLNFNKLDEANEELSGFFFLIFMGIFFFVLLNMFLAIVMSTYILLRSRNQLLLEAKAKILTEESDKFIESILNLLFCRVKTTIEQDALRYKELAAEEISDEEEQEAINEEMRKLENSILQESEFNILNVIKYNFGEFNEIRKGSGGTKLTKEQYKQNLKRIIEEIEREKRKKKIHEELMENDVERNFDLVKEMFIFLIYIIVFTSMIILRLRISESYNLESTIKDTITKETFTHRGAEYEFQDISNDEIMYNFIQDSLVDFANEGFLTDAIYFVGNIRYRITLKRVELEKNNNPFSENVIPYTIDPWIEEFSDEEFFYGENHRYFYSDPGLENFEQGGGYVEYVEETDEDLGELFKRLERDQVMNQNGKIMAIEWVMYCPNLDLYAYNYILFDNYSSGQLSSSIYSGSIDISMFSEQFPTKPIIEVVFMCFTLYYFIAEFLRWRKIWVKLVKEYKISKIGEKAVQEVLRKIKQEQEEEGTGCIYLTSIIKEKILNCLKIIFKTILRFLISLKLYIQKDLFNIFNIISHILSLIMIFYIFQLFLNDFRRDFDIENPSENYIGEFAYLESIWFSYRSIACYNSLIIFIRLLQFFKFSKQLSLLTDILNSAKLDIAFFMMMFVIILFAYSLMGYILLGHFDANFAEIRLAIISCYLMLLGTYDRESIENADEVLGMVFFVTFMIIFNLILLNMFIAIIGAHFETLKPNTKESHMGFFRKIISVIKAKIQKKEKIKQNFEEKEEKLTEISFKDEDRFLNEDIYNQEEEIDMEYKKAMEIYPNAWMEELEHQMRIKTNYKMSLSDLRKSFINKNQDIYPAFLDEIAIISDELWVEEPIYEKLRIWRQLTNLFNLQIFREKERAIQISIDYVQDGYLSEKQRELWNITPAEQKIEMWIGQYHFNDEERMAVWNESLFKSEFFEKEGKNWNSYKQRSAWETLETLEEKLLVVRGMLEPIKKDILKIRKSKNPVKYILKRKYLQSDTRLMLWVGLSHEKNAKLFLYMNEIEPVEAEILKYLIIEERRDNIFALDEADDLVAGILDSKFWDKSCELSIYESEMKGLACSFERLNLMEEEIKMLANYKVHIAEEAKRLANSVKRIEIEIRELFGDLNDEF